MISTVTGTIRSLSLDKLVIEVGGVGLSVLINPPTSAGLTLGSQSTLYTSLVVRESVSSDVYRLKPPLESNYWHQNHKLASKLHQNFIVGLLMR